jgi:hypothetical protein
MQGMEMVVVPRVLPACEQRGRVLTGATQRARQWGTNKGRWDAPVPLHAGIGSASSPAQCAGSLDPHRGWCSGQGSLVEQVPPVQCLQGVAMDQRITRCKGGRRTARLSASASPQTLCHTPTPSPVPLPTTAPGPPFPCWKKGACTHRNKTPTHGGDNTLSRCTYPRQEMGAA